jgi:hypothetical protein
VKYYIHREESGRNCVNMNRYETTIRFITEISFSTIGNTNNSLTLRRPYLLFEYSCQFDSCNSQPIESKIKEAIDKHTNFSSLHDVFKTKFQKRQIIKPTSRSTSSSTRSQASGISTSTYEQTTNQSSNASTFNFIFINNFIVYILFLIFFAVEQSLLMII